MKFRTNTTIWPKIMEMTNDTIKNRVEMIKKQDKVKSAIDSNFHKLKDVSDANKNGPI